MKERKHIEQLDNCNFQLFPITALEGLDPGGCSLVLFSLSEAFLA